MVSQTDTGRTLQSPTLFLTVLVPVPKEGTILKAVKGRGGESEERSSPVSVPTQPSVCLKHPSLTPSKFQPRGLQRLLQKGPHSKLSPGLRAPHPVRRITLTGKDLGVEGTYTSGPSPPRLVPDPGPMIGRLTGILSCGADPTTNVV